MDGLVKPVEASNHDFKQGDREIEDRPRNGILYSVAPW